MNEPNGPRILFWDIEATNLRADFGYILCIGYKFAHWKKPKIIKLCNSPTYKKDRTDDSYVLEQFAKAYATANLSVTWYGNRFDLPYVNARNLAHDLPRLPPVPQVDLWRTSRYELAISNNRLDTASRFLKLKDEKTRVDGQIWVRAMSGYKDALKYIYDHCYADVLVLEGAYGKLRSLVVNHPNVSLLRHKLGEHKCPTCSGSNITGQGKRVARTAVYQRLRCNDCGSWSQMPHSAYRGVPR